MFDFFSDNIGEFNMILNCHLRSGMYALLEGGRSWCDDCWGGWDLNGNGRVWIHSCIFTAQLSILVSGSPLTKIRRYNYSVFCIKHEHIACIYISLQ